MEVAGESGVADLHSGREGEGCSLAQWKNRRCVKNGRPDRTSMAGRPNDAKRVGLSRLMSCGAAATGQKGR